MNLNKSFVCGRVGANPELKTTPNGTQVTSFSLASNRVWTDKAGQKQEETEWHRIVAFGKTAQIIAQYSQKGSELLVEGRLQTRKWTDKQGVDRYQTEIVAENIQLGARPQNATAPAPAQRTVPATTPAEDETPFPTDEDAQGGAQPGEEIPF